MNSEKTLSQKEATSILDTVNNRVQSIEHGGQRLWVKTIRDSKKKIGHRVQKILANLIPSAMLRVTVNEGGLVALKAEVARLETFRKNGIHVPQVLYHTDTQIIMSDAGIILEQVLKDENDPEKRQELMALAASTLADIHQKNLFHGRPYMKDFIYDGKTGTLGFIDLEEDLLDVMTAEEAQARDVWMFLAGLSIFMQNDPERLLSFYKIYRARAPAGYEKPLQEFVRLLNPLSRFLSSVSRNKLGKDVTKATQATNALNLYFQKQS